MLIHAVHYNSGSFSGSRQNMRIPDLSPNRAGRRKAENQTSELACRLKPNPQTIEPYPPCCQQFWLRISFQQLHLGHVTL